MARCAVVVSAFVLPSVALSQEFQSHVGRNFHEVITAINVPKDATYSIDVAGMHDGRIYEKPVFVTDLRMGDGAVLVVRGSRRADAILAVGKFVTTGAATIRFDQLRPVGPLGTISPSWSRSGDGVYVAEESDLPAGGLWLLDGGRGLTGPLTLEGRSVWRPADRALDGMRMDVGLLVREAGHELVGRIAADEGVLGHELRVLSNGLKGRDRRIGSPHLQNSQVGQDGGDGGSVRLKLFVRGARRLEKVYGTELYSTTHDISAEDWFGERLGINIDVTGGAGGRGNGSAQRRRSDGRFSSHGIIGEDGRIVLETIEVEEGDRWTEDAPLAACGVLLDCGAWLRGTDGEILSDRATPTGHVMVHLPAREGTYRSKMTYEWKEWWTQDAVGEGNRRTDRAALEAFFRATDGEGWLDNTGWLWTRTIGQPPWNHFAGRPFKMPVPLERWYGVVMDEGPHVGHFPGGEDRVAWLELSDNRVRGRIPEVLGDLTNLRRLVLSDNDLHGRIPGALGNLVNLRVLDFSGNQLSGWIPGELGRLRNLTALHLSGNAFSGLLPLELKDLVHLTSLSLDHDTGLCLGPGLAGSVFEELAGAEGVPFCGHDEMIEDGRRRVEEYGFSFGQ